MKEADKSNLIVILSLGNYRAKMLEVIKDCMFNFNSHNKDIRKVINNVKLITKNANT